MTARARRVLIAVAALAAVQAALWLGYRTVDGARSAEVSTEATSWQRAPMQSVLERGSGSTTTLAEFGAARPVLLHFWATWCVPCVKELPTLLALERSPDRPPNLELVLISLDQEWRVIETFFGGEVPARVLRDQGTLASALGLSTLPDTYLLAADGTRLARFHGPRDWNSPERSRELEQLLTAAR